jgi:DNA topoisomerase-1
MADNLVIVESSAKSKRIAGFLGEGWRIEATRGPVRDLPQDRLGVEVNDDFRPQYVVSPRQANTVRRLLKAIRDAEAVYVATGPNRAARSRCRTRRPAGAARRAIPARL